MNKHDPDWFSFSAGLLFLVLGIALTVSAITGDQIDGRWLVPLMLTFLGAGGVAASLATGRRRQREAAQEAETQEAGTQESGMASAASLDPRA